MIFRNLLLLPLLIASLQAASVDDLTFSLINGGTEYSVSDCLETASGSLDIPSIHNGLPVTSIGDEAFQYCSNLISVSIPETVISTGDRIFSGCSDLTSITIPDSVTSIGRGAFANCTALTSITIGDNLTSIGMFAFHNTGISFQYSPPDYIYYLISNSGNTAYLIDASDAGISSTQNIIVPSTFLGASVTLIGDRAFYNNQFDLNSITIPESVTSIGDEAFARNQILNSITIPDSVTSIGSSILEGSPASITFSKPLLEAAVAERDARLTMDEVRDARVGSTMIEVSDGKADITMTLEETSDLSNWSSGATSNKTIQVDAPSGTRFYRFKMTE